VEHARDQNLSLTEAREFEALPGRGARAKVDGHAIIIGNEAALKEERIEVPESALQTSARWASEGKTPVFVGVDGSFAGLLAIADAPREHSSAAIAQLRRDGYEPWMLTGDNPRTADAIAQLVGITRVFAQVLPDQKAAVVREAQRTGLCVAMVGDGINDAPALAQADLGIAMGAGTDIALEASDITLIRSDLRDVPAALQLARQTLRNIKQNLFLAFIYNIVAIPLAAFNLLHPMIASAAMALSDVSVVGNALRLRRFRTRT
jgi:Cu+-exporting ATPase